MVAAPQHDPGGHGVFREVRMGPLVDVVRQAVAPVLQEFSGGSSVVDLVEMHLVRLGQAGGAQREAGDDENEDKPQIKPVETAAALPDEQAAAVGPDGWVAEPITE